MGITFYYLVTHIFYSIFSLMGGKVCGCEGTEIYSRERAVPKCVSYQLVSDSGPGFPADNRDYR